MKIGVILNSTYSDSETIEIGNELNPEKIRNLLDKKYGKTGWYSYDIL